MRMTSASTPDHHHKKKNRNRNRNRNSSNIPKSQFEQTVCLGDWWLVKPESSSSSDYFHGGIPFSPLAIAGFTSRQKQAMRVFSSAPILKRYDIFTLQTADGICVIIKGFINKARTVENGFPSDVFNHFVFGFPPYWKEYYENFMGGRNNWNFDFIAPKGPIDKMKSRELDADSVQDEFDLISETPSLDKDLRKVKTKGNMQKAKIRATTSLSTPAVADNQESIDADKNSLSKNVKASLMKTRRNLAYETLERENEKASRASPRSLSLKRSRSGRLLMPTLEFWRNQRAIYNEDRTITGIEEGIRLEQTRKVVDRNWIYAPEGEKATSLKSSL